MRFRAVSIAPATSMSPFVDATVPRGGMNPEVAPDGRSVGGTGAIAESTAADLRVVSPAAAGVVSAAVARVLSRLVSEGARRDVVDGPVEAPPISRRRFARLAVSR